MDSVMTTSLQRAVRALDPSLPVYEVKTMDALIARRVIFDEL